MSSRSNQRAWSGEAASLNRESSQALQPLHDDLAELSPSFDGIVYFAVDKWHKNNASAVATVQPESADAERYRFYKDNIAHHRVDLGATALGLGLQLKTPMLIPSRMNPDQHTTWTQRTLDKHTIAGGLQAAFKTDQGYPVPDARRIASAFEKHTPVIEEVANGFSALSSKLDSIGDMLELAAPTTPNAFIVGWDLYGSTKHAMHEYGRLRNYLIDAKSLFSSETDGFKRHFHDTGDGQDITLWLPDGVDRADPASIRQFGHSTVLPLIEKAKNEHAAMAAAQYADMAPEIKIAVGLGYVEQDRHDEFTSREYWATSQTHEANRPGIIAFSDNALRLLYPDIRK